MAGVIQATLMFDLGYGELKYPCEWPPREIRHFLPIQRINSDFWQWPKRQIHQILLNLKHRRTVKGIDSSISQTLAERPEFGRWPLDSEQLHFAEIVSKLLAEERSLERPPALHPKDPIPILFWYSCEGLMPLLVKTEFEKRFQIDSIGVIMRALDEKWTIASFLDSVRNCGK